MGNVVGCFKTSQQEGPAKPAMSSGEGQVLHMKTEAQVETPIEPAQVDQVDEKPEEEAYAQLA
ncbi:hypothetical protein P3T76_014498 [Phytophthora citrophthora]|uniref:Uncharacterized protein n=1 Tax=Phytophthora citrophthora TaxID=4793 RepID=A0AAD9G0X5_9STRA|nr:hypothetical protein P3T76_014498 [Phytophthora citrophthora]